MIEIDVDRERANFIRRCVESYKAKNKLKTISFFDAFFIVRNCVIEQGNSWDFKTYEEIQDALVDYNFHNYSKEEHRFTHNIFEELAFNWKMKSIHGKGYKIWTPYKDYCNTYRGGY